MVMIDWLNYLADLSDLLSCSYVGVNLCEPSTLEKRCAFSLLSGKIVNWHMPITIIVLDLYINRCVLYLILIMCFYY